MAGGSFAKLQQLSYWGMGMRFLSFSILLLLSFAAHSSLVDNGSYTSDTVSGLDWLDLTATDNLTPTAALAANAGWRHASNSEVEDLFNQLFPNYFSNQTSQNLYYDEDGINSIQWDNLNAFADLFGWTQLNGVGVHYYSYGLYLDEDHIWRSMGGFLDLYYNNTVMVTGMEFTNTYSANYSHENFGTFLVQTAVPVPAAVWLFGSALAGLGWMKRKRTI
jgi:hypothetical protein